MEAVGEVGVGLGGGGGNDALCGFGGGFFWGGEGTWEFSNGYGNGDLFGFNFIPYP